MNARSHLEAACDTIVTIVSHAHVETKAEMSGSGSGPEPPTSSCQDQTQIECIIGRLTKVVGTGGDVSYFHQFDAVPSLSFRSALWPQAIKAVMYVM
jgi:hypothetical protein